MAHYLKDLGRRDHNFMASNVKDVLPEAFSSEYNTLISFLESYYDFSDSTGDMSFNTAIRSLPSIRDIGQTEPEYLNLIIEEIGNGLKSTSFFEQPRLMARLLSQFYRSKGSLVSIEGFFRSFFNDEISVEYGKRNVFIVGESEIGTESLRYITDNKLYQTFAILIKSGVEVSDYERLYKKFVHPAGFYFAGELILETSFALNISAMPSADGLDDSVIANPVFAGVATLDIQSEFAQETGLYDSNNIGIRTNPDISIQELSAYTGGKLDSIYDNIIQLLTPNSFTFDDSANDIKPDMSLTIETMDNNMFTRHGSDSAI